MYTNITIPSIHAGVIETDVSDHFPIFAAFEHLKMANKTNHKKSVFRTFRNYDINIFHEDLGKTDWKYVHFCTELNESYSVFVDMFRQVCDKHAPIVSAKNKGKKTCRKPWMTKAILKSVNKKHKLYSKLKTANFQQKYEEEYKRYRNVLTAVLRNAKRQYYSNLFFTNKNDTCKTWKTINELLSGGKVMNKVTNVEKLTISGNGENRVITSDNEIANEFIKFFVNIGPKLAN